MNKFYEKLLNVILKKLGYNNCDMKTNGELSAVKYFLKHCDKDKVLRVVDVGACKGEWTDIVMKLNTQKTSYYLAEPLHEKELKEKYKDRQDVIINSMAIGKEFCTKTFYINKTISSLYL